MSDWYWDICPLCGLMGCLVEQEWEPGASVPTIRDRPCGACDGIGRVKVPTGYHLVPDAVARTTVSNITSPVKVLG